MQLILVQAEIEQALKDYVNKTMKLNDGVGIEIELTATRGAEGFKAFIDIRPASNPIAASTAVTYREPEPKTAPFSTVRTPEPIYTAAPAPELVIDPNLDPALTQAPEMASAVPAEDQSAPDEGSPEPGLMPPPSSSGRSLFKGLGKPKNN